MAKQSISQPVQDLHGPAIGLHVGLRFPYCSSSSSKKDSKPTMTVRRPRLPESFHQIRDVFADKIGLSVSNQAAFSDLPGFHKLIRSNSAKNPG